MTAQGRSAADQEAQRAFFDKALSSASEWTRFADPKALAVLVLLGLGLSDLLDNASSLAHAHTLPGTWSSIATGAFYAALGLAVATVCCVSLAVFPRLRTSLLATGEEAESLYYFGGIDRFDSSQAYAATVRSKSAVELESEIASQAWIVAGIAKRKHDWTQRAYVAVLGFLFCWALGRAALSFLG